MEDILEAELLCCGAEEVKKTGKRPSVDTTSPDIDAAKAESRLRNLVDAVCRVDSNNFISVYLAQYMSGLKD